MLKFRGKGANMGAEEQVLSKICEFFPIEKS